MKTKAVYQIHPKKIDGTIDVDIRYGAFIKYQDAVIKKNYLCNKYKRSFVVVKETYNLS